MRIKNLVANKILDSAGNWTVECWLETDRGFAKASVPTGISAGKKEKLSVPVEVALSQINQAIKKQLKNLSLSQKELDEILVQGDWGSNATLAVSAAFFKLKKRERMLCQNPPELMMLIFEGKKHGNKKIKIQEFMILVKQVEEGVRFYQKTKKYLEEREIITTVGSEGGFSPPNFNEEKVLQLLKSLKAKQIALDLAASHTTINCSTLLDIVRRYPIVSLEDPLPESDWQGWQAFYQQAKEINPEILIVADDLTVTDKDKIKRGAEEKLFNGVIIKPNQQGTISAAAEAIKTAQRLDLKTIVSHRGRETNDDWIVDFALQYQADFVKFGAPSRGERVAKYNRLLKLEDHFKT